MKGYRLLSIVLLLWSLAASAAEPRYQLTTLAEGLEHPWGMAFLPDGRLLISERPGRLLLFGADGMLTPITGLPQIAAGGQGGLLDVAWHDGWVYFSFVAPGPQAGQRATAVARARLKAHQLDDVQILFRQVPWYSSQAHFGSRLAFDSKGYLYITLGDRYQLREQAQKLDNHLGKVVRLHADGRIPEDNPFVHTPGALPAIWSYGHRNVQGAAVDRQTDQLWTHEHGPQGGDEVNIDRAGGNYGWPVVTFGEEYGGGRIGEGTQKAGMVAPLHVWVPSIAPSGMLFYHGQHFPNWQGNLLIGSLKFGFLVRLERQGQRIVAEHRLLAEQLGQRLRDIEQGPDGHLYLITDAANGRLLRLAPAPKD
ncbi:PQQ-dependent sugar dehydrogenase [Gallaecimonas sp. GXIMD1310]|uniref:PQQ-dependent sugar dehydrogenase n=1 Tax=Gallaecimonas sp. GXIMD1310 TaxID=3131926 RepID=UPI003252D53D